MPGGQDEHRLAAAYRDMLCELAQLAPPTPKGTLRGIDHYRPVELSPVIARALHAFERGNGFLPSVQSPRTYQEKIFVAKFLLPFQLPVLADKLLFKQVARKRFGAGICSEALWASGSVDGLADALRSLPPDLYFLKANHGSNMNLRLDLRGGAVDGVVQQAVEKATAWLGRTFGRDWGEFHYSTFARQVFIERALSETDPLDIRVYVFHDRVRMFGIRGNSYSKGEQRAGFLSHDLRHLPVGQPDGSPFEEGTPVPPRAEELSSIARALAKLSGMPAVRVDFFWPGGEEIRLAEVTYTPNNAAVPFIPKPWDTLVGSWWDLRPSLGYG